MNQVIINSIQQTKERLISLLGNKGYPVEDCVVLGMIETINLVSDYKEEGVAYYPELLIVPGNADLRTVLVKNVKLAEEKIDGNTFKKILKLCAPLAVNNWHIYVVLKEDLSVEYGLISAEIKETSLSLYTQVSELGPSNMIYIRNIGAKIVEIVGGDERTIISLSLDTINVDLYDHEKKLVHDILSGLDDGEKAELENFMLKSVREILRAGHGNLIVVCEKDQLPKVLERMSSGVILEKPIDMLEFVQTDNSEKSNESSVNIKSHLSLMKSMINHDGISIFSTKCELLGFHYIVDNNVVADAKVVGGARTKAFEALKKVDGISSCFFKSQDGQTKFYKK